MKMTINGKIYTVAMPENFIDRLEGMGFTTVYFDGAILPDDVKKELYALAKKEIEFNTQCGELPYAMVGNVRYYIDIAFDDVEGVVTATKLGCEMLLAENYLTIRGGAADTYKQFIGNATRNNNTNNLTSLCAGFSGLEFEPETDAERETILKQLNDGGE